MSASISLPSSPIMPLPSSAYFSLFSSFLSSFEQKKNTLNWCAFLQRCFYDFSVYTQQKQYSFVRHDTINSCFVQYIFKIINMQSRYDAYLTTRYIKVSYIYYHVHIIIIYFLTNWSCLCQSVGFFFILLFSFLKKKNRKKKVSRSKERKENVKSSKIINLFVEKTAWLLLLG